MYRSRDSVVGSGEGGIFSPTCDGNVLEEEGFRRGGGELLGTGWADAAIVLCTDLFDF
jgi:hypothetical protein